MLYFQHWAPDAGFLLLWLLLLQSCSYWKCHNAYAVSIAPAETDNSYHTRSLSLLLLLHHKLCFAFFPAVSGCPARNLLNISNASLGFVWGTIWPGTAAAAATPATAAMRVTQAVNHENGRLPRQRQSQSVPLGWCRSNTRTPLAAVLIMDKALQCDLLLVAAATAAVVLTCPLDGGIGQPSVVLHHKPSNLHRQHTKRIWSHFACSEAPC